MIKLKLLLEGKYDYGCLMAKIDDDTAREIIELNYSLIDNKYVYKEGKEYGRSTNVHTTVKYGLTKSYSEKKMREMLRSVKPFRIKIDGISLFENEKFDVVKLDVSGKELHELHDQFSKLPNKDEYDEYHPHITLAYVKSGTGKKFIDKKKSFPSIKINTLEYSDRGDKTFYYL